MVQLTIAVSAVGTPGKMRRPALACSAVRAGLNFRKDDPEYEGSVNALGNGLFIAHRDAHNWHMLAHVRGNEWYIKYAPQDMLDYYKVTTRTVTDLQLCQIINHFFREKPHAN